MKSSRPFDQPQGLPAHAHDRLDSWKEIAAYLRRDESTVRRWEKDGLPVHRHLHKSRAAFFAYKSEVDAWWHNDGAAAEADSPPAAPVSESSSRQRIWTWIAVAGTALVLSLVVAGGLLSRSRP